MIRATGDDSLVALFETASGVLVQLAFVPSGPGRHWLQRSVHGRDGSMSVPPDRSGGPVIVRLGDRTLSGGELRRELGGFELDGRRGRVLRPRRERSTTVPFAEVDAALDRRSSSTTSSARSPTGGRPRSTASAACSPSRPSGVSPSRASCGGSVRIADVADGTISAAQDPVDEHRIARRNARSLHMSSIACCSSDFKQVALVVRDLDEAVRRWADQLGIGPWTAYRLESARLKDMRYHEQRRRRSRSATRSPGRASSSSSSSSRSTGRASSPTISRQHGEGLHHIGKFVDDHPAAVAEALARAASRRCRARAGFGAEGDGAFAYFQPPGIALIVELIEAPRVRIEPEFVYPPSRLA